MSFERNYLLTDNQFYFVPDKKNRKKIDKITKKLNLVRCLKEDESQDAKKKKKRFD